MPDQMLQRQCHSPIRCGVDVVRNADDGPVSGGNTEPGTVL
jgi:hypothetical protein